MAAYEKFRIVFNEKLIQRTLDFHFWKFNEVLGNLVVEIIMYFTAVESCLRLVTWS